MIDRRVLFAICVVALAGCSRPEPRPVTTECPVEYPGLHNVVTFAKGLESGAAPEGRKGLETLAARGVKTIVSVDGAVPDVETAKKLGLRYVHLPIGYNGMERSRTLELARAIKELPGPVYVHCHHGKHRSACALGAATVALGLNTREQALEKMKVSGTAPSYKGLFETVASTALATEAELAATSAAFPEVSKPSDLVGSMLEIDELADQLEAIERAGWKAPPEHPDLVPAALAGKLADLFRHSSEDSVMKSRAAALSSQLAAAGADASLFEARLVAGAPAADLSARFKAVMQSCNHCHEKFRD